MCDQIHSAVVRLRHAARNDGRWVRGLLLVDILIDESVISLDRVGLFV